MRDANFPTLSTWAKSMAPPYFWLIGARAGSAAEIEHALGKREAMAARRRAFLPWLC
jgi:hypothetical protein